MITMVMKLNIRIKPLHLFAYAQQLVDGSGALQDLPQAVFVEIAHAALDGLLTDGVEIRVFTNHVANLIRQHQELENAGALEIARVSAALTNQLLIRDAFVLGTSLLIPFGDFLIGRRPIEELDLIRRQIRLAQ